MVARDLQGLSELQPSIDREVPAKAVREAVKFVNWLVANGVDRAAAVEGVRRFVDAVAGKRRQVKVASSQHPIVKALIARYLILYREVYRENLTSCPDVEVAHLARLSKQYALPVLEERLSALAAYVKEDAFMARFGFKPSTLANQWVRVTAYAKQRQPIRTGAPADCRHQPLCRDAHSHTQRMLQDTRNQR